MLQWYLSSGLSFTEDAGGDTDVLDWSLTLFQFEIQNCDFWKAGDERNVHLSHHS